MRESLKDFITVKTVFYDKNTSKYEESFNIAINPRHIVQVFKQWVNENAVPEHMAGKILYVVTVTSGEANGIQCLSEELLDLVR